MTDTLNATVFVDRFGVTAVEQQIEYLQLQAFPPFSDCKEGLPLLKLARFGVQATRKGCLRSDENLIALSGCEIDYDAGYYGIEYATEQLSQAGIECFLYTSPSHTQAVPRWRVLLPFEQEFSGTSDSMRRYRAEGVRRAVEVLGFDVASESYALSQAFYFGRVTRSQYSTAHLGGTWIDRLFDLHIPAPRHTSSGYDSSERVNVKRAIAQVLSGDNLHEPLRSLSASYAAKGMLRADIIAALQAHLEASVVAGTERWQERYDALPRLVNSAIEKFAPSHQMVLHELRVIWAAAQDIRKGVLLIDADVARLGQAINAIENEGRKLQCRTYTNTAGMKRWIR